MIQDHLIPRLPGHAVLNGWPPPLRRPRCVVWYWWPLGDLALARRSYGGNLPNWRGKASYHYAIGTDGSADRYVGLDDRAIQSRPGQTLAWDGQRPRRNDDPTNSAIQIAVCVAEDYDRPGRGQEIVAADPRGREHRLRAWSPEQIAAAVTIGREIVHRWPTILPEHHFAWDDLAPDLAPDESSLPGHSMPLGEILQDVYAADGVPEIPDVRGRLRTVRSRIRALRRLDYPVAGGDRWGANAQAALRRMQEDHGLAVNGLWTSHVGWAVWRAEHDRRRRSGAR